MLYKGKFMNLNAQNMYIWNIFYLNLQEKVLKHYKSEQMKRDTQIFEIIEKEKQRQLKGIELIASENFVSEQVMEAMG